VEGRYIGRFRQTLGGAFAYASRSGYEAPGCTEYSCPSPGRQRWPRHSKLKNVRSALVQVVAQAKSNFQSIVLDHAPESVWGNILDVQLVEESRNGVKLISMDWLREDYESLHQTASFRREDFFEGGDDPLTL